jgi:hypothetical protein
MEEHFVNYPQALALKELGYDEPCLAYYDGWNGQTHLIITDESPKFLTKLFNLFSKNKNSSYTQDYVKYLGGFCTAPLKSQVFKWFRDEHHLFANIYECTTGGFKDNIIPKNWKPECRWEIYKPVGITYSQKDKVLVHVSDNLYRHFYYYEEAESACIDNLIQIIKEKKS